MAIRSVSTEQQLYTAFANANAGDVIELAAGNYGDVWLYNKSFSSEVVIRSADDSNPAVFDTGRFQFLTNVTLDGILFDFDPDMTTVESNSAVLITDSQSVTIRNSVIEGGVSINGIPEDSPPGTQGASGIMGQPIGRGITGLRSQDISFENNEITSFFKGMVLASVDGLNVSGNDVYKLRGSPLVGADLHNVTVEKNYFHQSFPWNLGGSGDHGDYIHFWTTPTQTGVSQNFVIRDNFFEQGAGEALVGINLEGIGGPYGFSNVTIDNNVLHNGDSQAMRLSAVDGLQVTNNTLLQASGGLNDAPLMVLVDGTKNAVIANNLTAGINGNAYDARGVNNITTQNNIIINYTDPDSPNYVGNLFVNSSYSVNGIDNIRVVPGSPADGAGSSLTAFDTSPDKVIAGFRVDALPGESDTLVFDARSLTYDANGLVTDDVADYFWSFGDGFKSTGPLVQRTFADPGIYEVKLIVKMADGSSSLAKYTVGVAGDELVSFDETTGTFLSHGYGQTATAPATINALGNDGGDKVILLGGTGVQVNVSQAALADVFGADNFKMGFSLKSTDGANSAGEVFRIHGSFVGRIEADGNFAFEMYPVGGASVYTKSQGLNLNDGQVHDYQVALNAETGRLNVRIDGNLVSSTPVTGEFPEFPRDMTFGNPWGGVNYKGELHSFFLESYEPDYREFTGNPRTIVTTVSLDPSFSTQIIDDVVLDIAALDGNTRVLRDDASVVSKFDGAAISFDGQDDHAKLGRLRDVEGSKQLAVSIDFARSEADGDDARLF